MAPASVELETPAPEPDAHTSSIGFRQCSEVYVARFQKYEYTLSEIFVTCGT